MNNEIKFIHNSEIDLQRWDATIETAVNSRVYALSWYLDILNPDWHGLIYGDYQYIMPVIFSRKWGIKYAYQPVYSQQHGIFPPSEPEITDLFISFLQKKFRYFNVSLNSLNSIPESELFIEERKNFLLSLNESHDEISNKYSSHTKRYLKKSQSCTVISNHIGLDEFFKLKEKYGIEIENKEWIRKLKLIISHSLFINCGVLYGAYNDRNELCAVAFFLTDKSRYTYLSSVTTAEGKNHRAMYAIIDCFIKDHANEPRLLDFEGSNIEGIARFFKGFGAKPEIYQHLKYNTLPWIIKLIKK